MSATLRLTFRHLLALIAVAVVATPVIGQRPKFYADDPLARIVDTQDASGVQLKRVNLIYDEARNLLGNPGDPDMHRRAMNVNTIDEVPDSAWFTNRLLGAVAMSADDVAKGPDTGSGPVPGPWTVASGKSDGVTPGFTILDAAGTRWFIKFDPPEWREMATGAEVAVTKLFYALGYHVPENYLTMLRRESLVITERSTITMADGGQRRLNHNDIDRLLRMAARNPDGSYRVVASKAVSGKPVGPFLYEGTRSDDPNDVVPHEHRRELRGLRVFSAWTNHVDSKAVNSLDTLVTENGRQVVRHHLIDFGATMGSASIRAREFDEGHQYVFEVGQTLKGALGFGFYIPSFHFIDYPKFPAVGRFSAERFDPLAWKPRMPNPAFRRARPDDTFWAARRVMAFTDAMIRAAVKTGQYSDPAAENYLADTLIARRDAIGRAWLTNVNPVVAPVLDAAGTLRFSNAAVDAGLAKAPASYTLAWFAFDNATGVATPIGNTSTLPTTNASFVQVDISTTDGPHASWAVPVHAFFRRDGASWTLVGFERLPDGERR